MAARPMIVTSINPHARLQHQLRCFAAWQALGVRIRSVNIAAEADLLLANGLADHDIDRLDPADSGRALHGIAVPRIVPVLRQLQAVAGDAPVMLVNSDLYPAMRSSDVLHYWTTLADAVALTREECITPDLYGFADHRPYRGGLDAFVFAGDRLPRLLALLEDCPAAPRMAFGIPGWDYLMGALVRSDLIRGRIMDSGLLLHESHATTYSTLDEFGHYLPDIERLTGIPATDPTRVAEAFAQVIQKDCAARRSDCDMVKALYFRPPQDVPVLTPAACAIADRMLALSPTLGWLLRRESIALLAVREIGSGKPDFNRALKFFVINPDPEFRFTQRLMAILFCLLCRDELAEPEPLTTRYPPNNLHGKVVDMILQGYPEGSPLRRMDFAHLFGSELVEHGIFNQRLYNYLAESCETDEERALLTLVWTTIRSIPHAA